MHRQDVRKGGFIGLAFTVLFVGLSVWSLIDEGGRLLDIGLVFFGGIMFCMFGLAVAAVGPIVIQDDPDAPSVLDRFSNLGNRYDGALKLIEAMAVVAGVAVALVAVLQSN